MKRLHHIVTFSYFTFRLEEVYFTVLFKIQLLPYQLPSSACLFQLKPQWFFDSAECPQTPRFGSGLVWNYRFFKVLIIIICKLKFFQTDPLPIFVKTPLFSLISLIAFWIFHPAESFTFSFISISFFEHSLKVFITAITSVAENFIVSESFLVWIPELYILNSSLTFMPLLYIVNKSVFVFTKNK